MDQTENELRELLGEYECPPILERNTMGMLVQISHVPEKDVLLLECETNAAHKIAIIPPDKVMEAFHHPCLYIGNPSELFPRSKSL